VKHLSDDEIQNYLDGNSVDSREEITVHLEACRECRLKLEEYRVLSQELSVDHIPALSPAFAASVMTALERSEPEKASTRIPIWMSGAALFIFGVVASVYFMGSETLRNVQGLLNPANIPEPSFVNRYKAYIDGLNLDFSLLLMVALVLLVIALVDQIIRRRHKTVSFLAC